MGWIYLYSTYIHWGLTWFKDFSCKAPKVPHRSVDADRCSGEEPPISSCQVILLDSSQLGFPLHLEHLSSWILRWLPGSLIPPTSSNPPQSLFPAAFLLLRAAQSPSLQHPLRPICSALTWSSVRPFSLLSKYTSLFSQSLKTLLLCDARWLDGVNRLTALTSLVVKRY